MAGLLAWAADVVAGNGQHHRPDDEEELTWRSIRLRLSSEEQEQVRQLEERAATLQQAIQHLRLRIPPPDISRSLPLLHDDSLAAHSAFTSELNAHQSTQTESQAREAALRAENAAYAKAITTVKEQLKGKRQELISLNARLQDSEKELSEKRMDLNAFPGKSEQNDSNVADEREKLSSSILQSNDKSLREGEELQKTRADLRVWETNVARLNQEWCNLLQNSARWPSAAQREKELERRLRILSEQLVAKQGQADSLVKELSNLQLRLRKVTEIHRHEITTDAEGSMHKGKTRKTWLALSTSATNGSLNDVSKSVFHPAVLESDEHLLAAVRRIPQKMTRTFWHLWSSRKHMGTPAALRCLIVLYLFILHAFPFVMILTATNSS